MAGLEIIGAIASLAGTAVSAAGTIAAGKAQQAAANYEAKAMEVRAKEEQAAAQREAQELRRRKNLALSQLQARAAASGFTATDPTTLAIGDEISKYGTVQEQMAAYGGRARRAGLEDQAAVRRMEGQAARMAASYQAAGTILGGISSFASRFNMPVSQGGYGQFRYG